jgi:hypothetical protein
MALITLEKGSVEEKVGIVNRKLHSDEDERGMLVCGYKFRPVMGA